MEEPTSRYVSMLKRKGGADYIYSLSGYDDPPSDIKLDDGVYYNKYMYGNKIKMSAPLSDGLVEYSDGLKQQRTDGEGYHNFFNVVCRTSSRN